MKEIAAADLKPAAALPTALLHRSGTILVEPGSPLSDEALAVLREQNGGPLYLLEEGERMEEARQKLVNQPVAVDELEAGQELARPLYDPRGALLLEAGSKIPRNLAASLERRGIETIYFRRPEEEIGVDQGRALREALAGGASAAEQDDGATNLAEEEAFSSKAVETLKEIRPPEADPDDLNSQKLRRRLGTVEKMEVEPEGEALENQVRDNRNRPPATAKEKDDFTQSIADCLKVLGRVYARLTKDSHRMEVGELDHVASMILAGLIANRDLLTLLGTRRNGADYQLAHGLATAVISVNIGTKMGFGAGQIKSLALGAMLADIGLMKVPKTILDKRDKLTPREHAEIHRHPAHGLDMLQTVRGIPAEVPYVIYQSHERPNGSGYPCGKKDVVIHPFAKIVNAADAFTALCSERPYRRQPHTPYKAMERLVFMTSKRLLNADITRNFLRVNSLFPVGSFVRLSNGLVGRVVTANPDDYMNPYIALLWDKKMNPLPEPKRFCLADYPKLSIQDVLDESEVPAGDHLVGF
jgi:HD-GYP domain-containing protein (c-di-GMP phosphodiesterase class II)